jgi:hypothetical protein
MEALGDSDAEALDEGEIDAETLELGLSEEDGDNDELGEIDAEALDEGLKEDDGETVALYSSVVATDSVVYPPKLNPAANDPAPPKP